MCNLYQHAMENSALRDFLAGAGFDIDPVSFGKNYEPDYSSKDNDGPIIRRREGGDALEIEVCRWGFPHHKNPKDCITNIRNLESSWWKNVNGRFLYEPEYRCIVPFSRFAEYGGKGVGNVWFGINSDLAFFAGIWRPWHGNRLYKVDPNKQRKRIDVDLELYAFLTTEPNGIVEPIHSKAMPVILTNQEECQTWLSGGAESLALQRALPDEMVFVDDSRV